MDRDGRKITYFFELWQLGVYLQFQESELFMSFIFRFCLLIVLAKKFPKNPGQLQST